MNSSLSLTTSRSKSKNSHLKTSTKEESGRHSTQGSPSRSKDQNVESNLSKRIQSLIADVNTMIIEYAAHMIEAHINYLLIYNFCELLKSASQYIDNLDNLNKCPEMFSENEKRQEEFKKLMEEEIDEIRRKVTHAFNIVMEGFDSVCTRGIEDQRHFLHKFDEQMQCDIESKVRDAEWGTNIFNEKWWPSELRPHKDCLVTEANSLDSLFIVNEPKLSWRLQSQFRDPWLKVSDAMTTVQNRHNHVVQCLLTFKSKLTETKNNSKSEKQKERDLEKLEHGFIKVKRRVKEALGDLPKDMKRKFREHIK